MNHSEIVSFVWGTANLIRDSFRPGKYQDVVLPLTVLRRIDCLLAPRKAKVLVKNASLKGKLENLDPQLRKASGFAFYNTSRYDFERLLADPANIAANLRDYINGFSENIREVIEGFGFDDTITRLERAGLLYKVVERFKSVDLHLDRVDDRTMGTIFEELLRRFNEVYDESPGEHFTPRDVVHLMVDLMLAGDDDLIHGEPVVRTICDPCCGSGGLLIAAQERILGGDGRRGLNSSADVRLFGQEMDPEVYALCRAILYMRSPGQCDGDNILLGSTLSEDRFSSSFDYQIANPPYGADWRRDLEAVKADAATPGGRFRAGTPRTSDSQLLFLQHMLAHMRPAEEGGGRVAIIMNGTPLFQGDAGSGESEIRRWVLENDWLEAIVALPEQLYYNTGIPTYVWLLSNHKASQRRGHVQLIDATTFWTSTRTGVGRKHRETRAEGSRSRAEILKILREFKPGAHSKIYRNTDFGYRTITVLRPPYLDSDLVLGGVDGIKPASDSAAETGDGSQHLRHDPELSRSERVPLDESVEAFLERCVRPYVADAWVERDLNECEVGYSIDFGEFGLERLRRSARDAGLQELPARAVVDRIRIVTAQDLGIDDLPNSILVPRSGFGSVFSSIEELEQAQKSYFQIQLRQASGIQAADLAEYLNSAPGKAFRQSLMPR
ncbi:MAG: class I SAM-dependent DNA methyltransferase, partial [Planctomycetota bacterium]